METEINKIVGASNRILEIDLKSEQVKELQVDRNDRKLYLGGKGLGLKLLFERLQPGNCLRPEDQCRAAVVRKGV